MQPTNGPLLVGHAICKADLPSTIFIERLRKALNISSSGVIDEYSLTWRRDHIKLFGITDDTLSGRHGGYSHATYDIQSVISSTSYGHCV